MPLPACKVQKSAYYGTTDIDTEAIYRQYGDNASIIRVPPAFGENRCGETIVTQKVFPQNCCDGVERVVFDTENSVSVMSPSSSGTVYATGGEAPYTWIVRGSGFYVDEKHSHRDAVTTDPYLKIYTSDACGACMVMVDDGCTQAYHTITATAGHWGAVIPGISLFGAPDECVFKVGWTRDHGYCEKIKDGVYQREDYWKVYHDPPSVTYAFEIHRESGSHALSRYMEPRRR